MRCVFQYTLGIAAVVQATVAVRVVSAQASGQHACSLFQPAELIQLTKRKDIGNQGPQPSGPPELAKGTTECDFVNVSVTLTENMTPAWFTRDRGVTEKATTRWKVQSVSGIGDEAYYMWDPRPGSDRSVGIVIRASGKRLSVGDTAPSDSIEAIKGMLLSIAKMTVPRVKQ